jgi:glucose-1-phosphate thymidylyltransferase
MPVNNKKHNNSYDLVGVIPAAGTASRLGRLPCSKELLPVGSSNGRQADCVRTRAMIDYLLEKMRLATARKVYIVLREGKWDIPSYLGDGKSINLPIAYLMMDLPFGVPFTIDQTFPFVEKSIIIFGFADILFEPQDAFIHLLTRQAQSNADVVLGLFRSRQSQNEDMVELNKKGRICKIEMKPVATNQKHTWLIAVWTKTFTRFLHDFVEKFRSSKNISEYKNLKEFQKEIFLGDVFNAAIDADLHINHVLFKSADYIDIGTPENLVKASQFNLK